ncbi:unnamed protein product [Clonostachys solani]|uniref:Uncharacterized protein n=1 Tax=Clonostachys solani TaxID=160281 RepID=A0A9P0ELG0_9HYPO|nr:unnamed protein product [Clonostachys solani]
MSAPSTLKGPSLLVQATTEGESPSSMRAHAVKRARLRLGNAEGQAVVGSELVTIDTLLEHVSPQLSEARGRASDLVSIVLSFNVKSDHADPCGSFLPHVAGDAEGQGLVGDADLCRDLEEKLHLEPFFLTHQAWNSNGFFIDQQVCRSQSQEINRRFTQGYATRFLIKFLGPDEDATVQYNRWLFLSFSVLWVRNHHTKKVSCVLVCYDGSEEIQSEIVKGFRQYPLANIKDNPYAVYDALLRVIIWQYNKALWLFRVPIRTIEKASSTRVRVVQRTMALQPSAGGKNFTDVGDGHEELFELSRHTLHMCETLEVAMRTTSTVLLQAESQVHSAEPATASSMRLTNTISGIRFSSGFLENLKNRADVFSKRVENEIKLADNMVNVLQLKINQELLEESRDESKDLTKFVTNLTLFFLPITFVSGFWGMNMIGMGDDRLIFFSPHIWIFVVSAVISVVLSYAAWYLVLRFTKAVKNK